MVCVLHELAVALNKELCEQMPGVQRCCVGSGESPGWTGVLYWLLGGGDI